jgi:hypothetical protein
MILSRELLTYWALPTSTGAEGPSGSTVTTDARSSADAPAGTSVDLPAGATASGAGTSPLVLLADHSVAVVRGGALVPVPLPAGARALAADDAGVLAVTATGWLRQSPAGAASAPHPLPTPRGASGSPLRVEAVGTQLLLTAWAASSPGAGQLVALFDTRTSSYVIQGTLLPTVDMRHVAVIRESGGTQVAVGPVVVDTYAAKLDLLDPRYTVKALTRGHAWTTLSGHAVDLRLTSTGQFPTVPFDAGEPALPVGISRLGTSGAYRAVIVAPAGNGWRLFGLGSV